MNNFDSASVFESGNIVRVHPGFRFSGSDLVTRTSSSISKMYGGAGSGVNLTRNVVVTLKEEVLAAMHKKFGTKVLLCILPVEQREYKNISEQVESGRYYELSMQIAAFKQILKPVKIRKGTSSDTIRDKIQETVRKIDGLQETHVQELSKQCLERLGNHFNRLEADYEDLMIGLIDRNAEHFDAISGKKASDLKIKIAGLKAQLSEAQNQLQELRNEQVFKFAESDGKISQHAVKAPVLETIKRKASNNEFFNSLMGMFH